MGRTKFINFWYEHKAYMLEVFGLLDMYCNHVIFFKKILKQCCFEFD
jgi:hypothetical protein